MTGTIKPFADVSYKDPKTRYMEYQKNIKRYIKESNFDIIIFTENSGVDFKIDEIESEAEKLDKIFEYIPLKRSDFENENMSSGDAIIVKQALEKSKYLNNKEQLVWKVSGRIWIRNINKILKMNESPKIKNVFLYAPKYDSIQTWLFASNLNDLENYFLQGKWIIAMRESCIEYKFMEVYRKYSKEISISKFNTYPDVEGINSSGQAYTMPKWKWVIKNILLKLGYFTVKVKYEERYKMSIIKEILYRIRGEYTTEKLISMGMKVGKNFGRLHGVILDPSHCWMIEIGDDVTMAPRVHVLCHDASTKVHLGYTKIGKVKIGNNVFVGAESVIMPNVTLGNNVIVGANSTVTKSFPDNVVIAGSPAKIITKTDEYLKKQKEQMETAPCYGEDYTLRGNLTEEKKQQMQQELEDKIGYVD